MAEGLVRVHGLAVDADAIVADARRPRGGRQRLGQPDTKADWAVTGYLIILDDAAFEVNLAGRSRARDGTAGDRSRGLPLDA